MSLAKRALWQGLVLVAALSVASVLGVLAYAWHAAQMQTLAHLEAAGGIATQLQDSRMAMLRLRADTLADDPSFVDYMAQSLMPDPARNGAIDKASIIDLLSQRRHGYDLAMVLGSDGREAAASGLLLAGASALQHDAMVRRVIASGNPMDGLWIDDGRLLQVVVEPLQRAGAMQGLLLTARQLDVGFVEAVARTSHANVALIAGPGPTPHPALVNDAAPGMQAALDALRPPPQLPADGRSIRLHADGHAAWGWIRPITASEGRAALVVFSPHAAAAAVMRAWPLLLGVLLMALIGFAAVLWHWKRIALPLKDLGDIIERSARGDHNLQARTDGTPSIRRLRDAINRWFTRDQAADAARTRLDSGT